MSQQQSVEAELGSILERAKEWEGEVINGEFRLGQYLGGSDHSAVFLTEYDEQDPRHAAIKVIPLDLEDAELQFRRWELATKLSHPHLLRIFQMGRCRIGEVNLVYLVMEYAEENLSQILPQRALTSGETRSMLMPTLDALAYLHEQGFVHSRIRPSNIMASGDQLKLSIDRVCPMGEPAARLDANAGVDNPALSREDDVWTLGSLLVEVLMQIVPASVGADLAELEVPEALPAPFFDIVRNCLRKDPRRRWTISDIALGMRALPSPEDQGTLESRPRPAKQNHPPGTLIASIVALALLLAAGLALPNLLRRGSTPQSIISAATASVNTPETKIAEQDIQNDLPNPPAPPIGFDDGKIEPDTAHSLPSGSLENGGNLVVHTAAPANTAQTVTALAEVVHQELPDVPESARDTIRGTVRVSIQLSVDSSGKVNQADAFAPGPSAYFAGLALRAARQWTFKPVQLGGQNTPREWLLRFDFSATDTKVDAKAITNGLTNP